MFTVILILWGSAAIGYVLRRHPFRAVGRLTTWSVWLLLFLMGCEVGANPDLISQLGTLGMEALILTAASFAGCMGLSWAFWGYLQKHPKNKNTGLPSSPSEASSSPVSPKPSIRQQTVESMVIVGFFAFGVSGTRLGWIPVLPPEAGFYALCLLLGCVGFSRPNKKSIPNINRTKETLATVSVTCRLFGSNLKATVCFPGATLMARRI